MAVILITYKNWRLETVEHKVVGLTDTLEELSEKFTYFLSSNSIPSIPSASSRRSESAFSASSTLSDPTLQSPVHVQSSSRRILTVPHRIILWPCIRQLLIDSHINIESDLRLISEEGTKFFIRQEMAKHPRSLPHDIGPSKNLDEARTDGSLNLTIERMMQLSDAYFRTFNVLLPILNYDVFVTTTLEKFTSQGFAEGDMDAVLALFVFALGQLASEGVFGQPINTYDGVSSGFRGGKTLLKARSTCKIKLAIVIGTAELRAWRFGLASLLKHLLTLSHGDRRHNEPTRLTPLQPSAETSRIRRLPLHA